MSSLGRDRFVNGKHLVLSSREGGDISVLLGLGVNPKNIIAVEMNPEAARQAQEKFPSVPIIQDDAFTVARRHHRSLSSIFYDFCSPMSDSLLKKVIQTAAYGIKDNGVLGCGFLAGREKGKFASVVGVERAEAHQLEQHLSGLTDSEIESRLAAMGDGIVALQNHEGDHVANVDLVAFFRSNPEAVRECLTSACRETIALRARAAILGENLVGLGMQLMCVPLALAYVYYMSTTSLSKGVPMLYYAGRVLRAHPGQGVAKLKKMALRFMVQMPDPLLLNIPTVTEEDLPLYAVRMTNSTPWSEVPQLLNVPAATTTAWHAHHSRGTYDERLEQFCKAQGVPGL
ncbi:MAG: hypothetical protein BWY99_01535 [Synergistetes bacterium ADurb.BinA166]|nr:MAG: hypothetical protein BWY99_01535 [Synergistetes bacterium ADurb.BinA166]